MKHEKVLERVYNMGRLRQAWQQVRKNAGAAGVDKMTVDAFEKIEEKLLSLIQRKLKAGHYRFKPARRVYIPKPGTSKKRGLGIPVVMDRIVSQSINLAFMDIFSIDFTSSNFGFQRGKSQHQAIGKMRQIISEGFKWSASIDLQNFFDEIPHGLILKHIRRKIKDERLVTLIVRALKSGIVEDGEFQKTIKGVPQGSPLSPILSNIVLNELDQELERRGHRYCRWADDFLIFLKSERAAKRVMGNITRFLEEELGLTVNQEKSCVIQAKQAGFLGFQILRGKIRVSTKTINTFKSKVRELTKRNNPLSMSQIIQKLNEYLQGWVGYYRAQEFKQIFRNLDGFIRSRLRSMQLKKWKKPKKFQRMMVLAGYKPEEARKTWIKMSKWQSVMRPQVRFVLNLKWFKRLRLIALDSFTKRNLELNFDR